MQGRLGDGAARRLCGAHAQADEGKRQGIQGIPAQLIVYPDGIGLFQKSLTGLKGRPLSQFAK